MIPSATSGSRPRLDNETAVPRQQDKLSAAEKTLSVLEAMLEEPRFSDVVAATGLAKATVHRLLATLSARGFVTICGDGTYIAGPKIFALAGQASRSNRLLEIAEPLLDELVARTGCTAHLGTLNGDRAIYTMKMEAPDKPYQMPSRVGGEIPLNSSGIGKAILSGFSPEQFDRYLAESELVSRTMNSIHSAKALRTEIELTRRRGYALDAEENVPGVICVAAPIYDNYGRVLNAVSISTITLEWTLADLENLAPFVVTCASRISDAIGYYRG